MDACQDSWNDVNDGGRSEAESVGGGSRDPARGSSQAPGGPGTAGIGTARTVGTSESIWSHVFPEGPWGEDRLPSGMGIGFRNSSSAGAPAEGTECAHNFARAGCVLCPARSLPSRMFGERCAHLLNFHQPGPCWLSMGGGLSLTPLSKSTLLPPHSCTYTRAGLPSLPLGRKWLLLG